MFVFVCFFACVLVSVYLTRILPFTGSKIKQIDLAATVEHLRDQRMQMVKTKVCQSVPLRFHLLPFHNHTPFLVVTYVNNNPPTCFLS